MAVGAEVVVVLFPSKPLSREEEVVDEEPTAVVVAGAEPNPNPEKQKNNSKWRVSDDNDGLYNKNDEVWYENDEFSFENDGFLSEIYWFNRSEPDTIISINKIACCCLCSSSKGRCCSCSTGGPEQWWCCPCSTWTSTKGAKHRGCHTRCRARTCSSRKRTKSLTTKL